MEKQRVLKVMLERLISYPTSQILAVYQILDFTAVVDLSLGEVGGLTKEFHQLGLYFN